jgi:UTP-glucose-1-phosphate uridylyltransferase
MTPALLVLAAGIGHRYGGLKQIDSVGPSGEVVLDYSVYDALRAGFGKVVFVIRREIESDFKEIVGRKFESQTDVRYIFQELTEIPSEYVVPDERAKPWGTAHATMMAEQCIQEPFVVINADDFYGAHAYRLMYEFLSKQDRDSTEYAMVGFTLRDTLSEYGHVARGICEVDAGGKLVRIVERTKISKEGRGAFFVDENDKRQALTGDEPTSMNFWGLSPSIFKYLQEELRRFLGENIHSPKTEFYLPTVVDSLLATNRVSVRVLPTRTPWFGITYRQDKPQVISGIRELIRKGSFAKDSIQQNYGARCPIS